MTDREQFQDYKNNPTIEKRTAIVEKHLYMVDILIKNIWEKVLITMTFIRLGLWPLFLPPKDLIRTRGLNSAHLPHQRFWVK